MEFVEANSNLVLNLSYYFIENEDNERCGNKFNFVHAFHALRFLCCRNSNKSIVNYRLKKPDM